MTTTLERVSSADGTQIALEVAGTGRPVVLIGGAFNDRTTMTGLARVLSRHYQAVITTGGGVVTATTSTPTTRWSARWRTCAP